jgi:phage repressor protein C with HTH and peptisase S24 domain
MQHKGGLTQSELAKAAGIKPQAVQHICDQNKTAKGSTHTALFASILGVSALWLETGEGQPISESIAQTSQHNCIEIDMLDVEASAGHGSYVQNEDKSKKILVEKQWFNSIVPKKAERIKAIKAVGDSMEPTIADGDALLVDTGVTHLAGDGIYVALIDEVLQVKRLQKADAIIVISDNKAYKDRKLKETAIKICGKVVGVMSARAL